MRDDPAWLFPTAEEIALTATIEELATAISCTSSDPVVVGNGDRFLCPRCRFRDHNGPTAMIRSSWQWWCWKCRGRAGTLHELRRAVLEDPDAVLAIVARSR
jgi:hypothetical protein